MIYFTIDVQNQEKEKVLKYSKRISLHLFNDKNPDHVSIFKKIRQSPIMMRYNNTGSVNTSSSELNEIIQSMNDEDRYICYDNEIPIGMCSFFPGDGDEDVGFSYFILRRFQGKGYGKELLSNIISYCREKKFKIIKGLVHKDNIVSQSVLLKFGFKKIPKIVFARGCLAYIFILYL